MGLTVLGGVRELLTVLRGVSMMRVVDCVERCQCDESCGLY